MDLIPNEMDCIAFLFYLARNKPEAIPSQLETDLIAEVAELEADYVLSLTRSELEYEVMHNGLVTGIANASFLDNLYYLGDRNVEYKLSETLLSIEGLKQYWSPIEFTKLWQEYENQDEI